MMMQRRSKKLGEILLAQGLINHDQLMYALQESKRLGVTIGSILVKLGYIKDEDLTAVLGQQIQLNQRKRIGEVLVDQGFIQPKQIDEGLEMQKRSGKQLGKCLVELGYISEEKLIDVLSAQLDIQHVVLDNFQLSPRLADVIPEEMVRRYKIIPLYENNGVITVAMADPSNLRTIDHLKFKTGREIEPVIASEKSIVAAIERIFSNKLANMAEMLGGTPDSKTDMDVVSDDDEGEQLTDEEGQQVVKIVNLIVSQAIADGASDIHIEPMERYYRLRYRIDGDLVEKNPIPLTMRAQIVSRLKIMANMDIAEKRRPQDGQFQIRYQGREVDLRVNTFPAKTRTRGTNEKIVMRIIDNQGSQMNLDQLGFLPAMRTNLDKLLSLPDGILLVTGPTGSGKSTTLYAGLASINMLYQGKKNITTMEDPVESVMDGITQGQINNKADFTFAAGMRAILRQDPDIIMVGEMRDLETARMAIQAALTGHMVFSTLHTNDSASAYTRLFDMGIESYLVACTVRGILAQRLVRRICSRCRAEYQEDPVILQKYGIPLDTKLFKGQGCQQCHNSGYKGRTGVYELLVSDQQLERLVVEKASTDEIKKYLLQRGDFLTLRQDGLQKVMMGVTTLEQVLGSTLDD